MGTRARFVHPKGLVSSLGCVPGEMGPPDMCLCVCVDGRIRVQDVSEEPLGAVSVRMFSGNGTEILGTEASAVLPALEVHGLFFPGPMLE